MILIITSSVDCTVDYIMKKYSEVDFFRVNVDEFSKYKICVGSENGWTISIGSDVVYKDNINSIYYRKPMLPDMRDYLSVYHNMIAKDIISIINGIVDSYKGKVLTKPYILRRAENKVTQLLYAIQKGMLIPMSYIGNDNNETASFSKLDAIIKPITTGRIRINKGVEIFQTNFFNYRAERDISLTPVYVQKYIKKAYEVRLTYINGFFFTVRIDAENRLDWRADYENIKYSIIECPKFIQRMCINMLNEFRLNFGAFDFIVDERGKWIFLEVNPNGQWLWLEKILDLSISYRIVDYLNER